LAAETAMGRSRLRHSPAAGILLLAFWLPVQQGPDPDRLLLAWSAIGRDGAVRELLEENDQVDIGARDDEGWTALMHAARGGYADTVEVLLEHGANVYSENNEGATALHIAAQYGKSEVVELLLKAGADYEATDALGRTPFYRAFENKHADVINVLHAAAQADADRLAARQDVPGVGKTVSPELVYSPRVPYTITGLKERIEGTVVLMLLVRRDGTVGPVNVSQNLEESLDRRAVRVVRGWRFTPALRNGKPVEAVVEIKIDFELPDHDRDSKTAQPENDRPR
jgi:TonB family protein